MSGEKKAVDLDPQYFFVDSPMYKSLSIEDYEEGKFSDFLFSRHAVDAYCRTCGKMSQFGFAEERPSPQSSRKSVPKAQSISRRATCNRSLAWPKGPCGEVLLVVFVREGSSISKIGQFPSGADLDLLNLGGDLLKQLRSEHKRELKTAIMLHSHGLGVGAFAYLRRIFEHFIYKARGEARKEDSWNEEDFFKLGMPEKIKALRNYLPKRLSQNHKAYSVLSKGIHELSEDECLENFALLYTSIVAILKEKAEEEAFEEATKHVKDVSDRQADAGSPFDGSTEG